VARVAVARPGPEIRRLTLGRVMVIGMQFSTLGIESWTTATQPLRPAAPLLWVVGTAAIVRTWVLNSGRGDAANSERGVRGLRRGLLVLLVK
jgi:hypothetical protein